MEETPLIVLTFADSASAERQIAGLPVAARAVAEAVQAGLHDIGIILGRGRLSAATASEIGRVGEGATVRMLGRVEEAPGAIEVFADASLLTSSGITRLLMAPGCSMMRAGVRVAVNAPPKLGGRALQAAAGEVVDLRNPGAASREILRGTSKPGDGLVSRWLNRPVSQAMSGLLLRVDGARPWHATMAAAAIGLAMILSLLFGGKGGLIAGAILFHAASVVDGVDGEIARATYRSSKSGAVLDTTVDMITNLGFFIGLTVAVARLHGPTHWIEGGLSVALAMLGMLAMRSLARRVGEPGNFNILKRYYAERYPTGIPAAIVWLLVTLTSRDTFAFVFAVVIVLGGATTLTVMIAGFISLWIFLIAAATPGLLRQSGGYSSVSV